MKIETNKKFYALAIRDMQEEDLAEVLQIERLSFPYPWSKRMFLYELRIPFSKFLVVQDGGKIIAYAGFCLRRDTVHFVNFAVHPDWRQQGIGKKFLNILLEKVKQLGTNGVTLELRISNLVAKKLYEKAGFKQVGIKEQYYNNQEDALIMHKIL